MADEFKNKGNEAFKAKDYKKSIEFYTKAIDLDPASVGAGALYSNRSASYAGLNDWARALTDAENCVRVRPDWLKGYFRKGVALEAMGRIDDAHKAFAEASKQEAGNSSEIQEKLSSLNTRIRERNDAATPAKVQNADEARTLGNSLFGVGKYDQAAAFYTRAIELYKGPCAEKANCFSNRAACHQQVHNYKAVVDDCNKALELDGDHPKALMRRAIAFEGLEKWQLALDDYTKVNRLSPGMNNVSQGVLRCQRAIRF